MDYRVVFPRGDTTRLGIAQMFDYEESEWLLASRQRFDTEEEADAHAVYLATKHGLYYENAPHESLQERAYLD